MNLFKKALQALLPDGSLNGPWDDKYNGSDLEKYIEGLSGQFNRDRDQADEVRYALDPYKTEFLDELDDEFFSTSGGLTEAERRGRIDGRFQMMVDTKLRLELMERIVHLAGFTDVRFRTLGWDGAPEVPADFFEREGETFYGSNSAIFGNKDTIFGATSATGGSFLITNGGSIRYADQGYNAAVQLQSEPWYHGAYFICESNIGDPLIIPNRLYETFWDLLYLVKPAKMHGILRAVFV